MEGLNLHSLILEELSETLATTYAGAPGEELLDDAEVRKIVAQCPDLTEPETEVTGRHEDGILALAKLVSQGAGSALGRQSVLDRLLEYVDALPQLKYRAPAFGMEGEPRMHWFVQRLVGRLVECAGHSSKEVRMMIMARLWGLVEALVAALAATDAERMAETALPGLLGALEALESTPFRFGSADVEQAASLAPRLVATAAVEGIRRAVVEKTPGAVRLYLQRGVRVSPNHVLGRYLRALCAVLASHAAWALVDGEVLERSQVAGQSGQQLWNTIVGADREKVRHATMPQKAATYERVLEFSLATYTETRALVLAANTSDVETGAGIMSRALHVAVLASLLRGSLDGRVMAAIGEHLRSAHVQQLAALTEACFGVLGAAATLFAGSSDAAVAESLRFVTTPPQALAAALAQEGAADADEERLLSAAAAALSAGVRGRQAQAVATVHTLFNALAVRPASSPQLQTTRVTRNVALVLARLAQQLHDSETTALVATMLGAPRFGPPAQRALVVQCAAAVAVAAERTAFVEIVGAMLKRIDFTDSDAAGTGPALESLATRIGDQRDLVDAFFDLALRALVDASIETPAPSRFSRRRTTPLSIYLPIVHALVRAHAYTPREATPEHVSLWRNFWLHMAVRGYLTEASYVAAYGRIYADLAARAPILVHPSSVNYLETEIEYSSVLQCENSESALARLRQALAPLTSPQSQALLRSISFPQAAFLLAAHSVELARATAGDCATVLRYFANAAVASSRLLPAIESIASIAISAYVRETTSRRWSVEESLAASGPAAENSTSDSVAAQVRQLMVASCHHLELVSRWAQQFVDRILRAFPQALLDRTAVSTLLELVQLVWRSCKAEQDDQFVPVYWFSSPALDITLQLPDSIAYRKTLFAQFSASARRWLQMAATAAPMELETLLQLYLSSPTDADLNAETHIGHALALEIGCAIRYTAGPSANAVAAATTGIALPPNSSQFAYRLGQRDFLRGYIGRGTDVEALKKTLSDAYVMARARPGEPLPQDAVSTSAVIDAMNHAAHFVVAGAPHVDRELVHLLVWAPLTLLDQGIMRAAVHTWTTLIVERSDVEVLIMVELTIAWTWLIQQHLGLFSLRFEPRSPFVAKMSYTPSDKTARARAYAAISHTLAPHLQVIEFVSRRFDAVRHLPRANFSVINAVLRILQVTFDNADRISSNALARGPLFMLVSLGFRLLKLGFESSPILETKLRDGLFDLAFRWFALPPCWSFSGSKASLAREIQILIDARHAVKGDSPVLRVAPTDNKWSASGRRPSSRGSNSAPTAADAPRPLTALHRHHHHHLLPHPHLRHLNPLSRHWRQPNGRSEKQQDRQSTAQDSNSTSASSLPGNDDDSAEQALILNAPRENLKRRALRNRSLLLLLLESEICRMATWANPTDQNIAYFPDVSRFTRRSEMTEQGWHNLAIDAWVASPRLAVQLLQRFSHPAIRHELTSLVCKFPGELVHEPEALTLLIECLRGGPGATAPSDTALTNSMPNGLPAPLTFRELKFLLYWTAVPPITSTAYLASSNTRNPLALQYSMRALESFPVDVTFFYIPQLVQALRHDISGYVERAILSSARISQHFSHQIIWNMKANMYRDEDSQVPDSLKPELERIIGIIVDGLSGSDRTYYEKEFGFFGKVTGISGKLKPYIKKSKPEKKRKIDEEMRKIKVEPGVYLPSNPDGTVVDIDYDSGRPLQSHAKAPFMATFVIRKPQEPADEVQELLKKSERTVTPSNHISTDSASQGDGSSEESSDSAELEDEVDVNEKSGQLLATATDSNEVDAKRLSAKLASTKLQIQRTLSSGLSDAPDLIGISQQLDLQVRSGRPSRESARSRSAVGTETYPTRSTKNRDSIHSKVEAPDNNDQVVTSRLSAIFKVGDDCRQDVLALQLIAVFKNIFTSCGLDLYLFPYRVVATAPGCGVIDVIPNSISRDQIGREKVNSLSDYFATKYHGVDSIQYQQARSNFVQSLAAYSVLSYLLQFKDRHNGNIMLDDAGHIVHIDFGFILDIAPGGITFESAPFKLTTEYIQVMGGSQDAQPYQLFCELCIKAYLACRPYADKIIQVVSLMLDSGLPCFKGETTLAKLRARFQLDRSERDAAQFMAERIDDSYENKRTVMYDQFQKATNGIPY
ncbi:phosphatidylinositol-4- kinase [Coemansia sp. RSA 552]|nr:phosphatidylinositol-4- kinase [Coemansia sp. RSA 552]